VVVDKKKDLNFKITKRCA